MRARDLSRLIRGIVVGNDHLKAAARSIKPYARVGNRTQQPREQGLFVVGWDDERNVRLHGCAEVPPNALAQPRPSEAREAKTGPKRPRLGLSAAAKS